MTSTISRCTPLGAITLSFVVISLHDDHELSATIDSINKAFSKADPFFSKRVRIIEVVSVVTGEVALNYEPFIVEAQRISGQDSSLYDAMNIGVRASSKLGSSHVVFLNSGALFHPLLSIPDLFGVLGSNPASIVTLAAEEVICTRNNQSRHHIIRPLSIGSGELPRRMPSCHQSIIYPVEALVRYPFLASEKLLASDYLNLLCLLRSGFACTSSPLLFCLYYNNGLSSQYFEQSIRQRCLAYALVSGRPATALFSYVYFLLRHLAARAIYIR